MIGGAPALVGSHEQPGNLTSNAQGADLHASRARQGSCASRKGLLGTSKGSTCKTGALNRGLLRQVGENREIGPGVLRKIGHTGSPHVPGVLVVQPEKAAQDAGIKIIYVHKIQLQR